MKRPFERKEKKMKLSGRIILILFTISMIILGSIVTTSIMSNWDRGILVIGIQESIQKETNSLKKDIIKTIKEETKDIRENQVCICKTRSPKKRENQTDITLRE